MQKNLHLSWHLDTEEFESLSQSLGCLSYEREAEVPELSILFFEYLRCVDVEAIKINRQVIRIEREMVRLVGGCCLCNYGIEFSEYLNK